MLTLDFRDELVNNPFSYNNTFLYTHKIGTGIFLSDREGDENPFIARSNKALHIEGEVFSSIDRQLQSRIITTPRLKEIMDSAKMPIAVRYGGINILAGKGFLSLANPDKTMGRLLFVACESASKPATEISQVRYYVWKGVLSAVEYKRIAPVVRSFMDNHRGEILLSDDIDQYIGRKILMPKLTTLAQKKEFATRLISHCIAPFCDKEESTPLREPEKLSDKKPEGIESLTPGISEDSFFNLLNDDSSFDLLNSGTDLPY